MQLTNFPISSVIAGHNAVSYKDIDLRYIDGILDVVKEELKTTTDIPKELHYHSPKDYTITQQKQLSEKVRNLWLKTEDDLQHLEQIATSFQRKMIPVSDKRVQC